MQEETITLDRESMAFLRTEKGGFTAATVKVFGQTWPYPKGWMESMLGITVTASQFIRAYKGRMVAKLTEDPIIILTKELIDGLRTVRGGFTTATKDCLDIKYGEPKGWPDRLIGKEITQSQYQKALLGRMIFSAYTLKLQKRQDKLEAELKQKMEDEA